MNKASGIYGIVSLFTGHPINFWQWLYNSLSIATLPIYTSALLHLQIRPLNVRKISIACLVYVIDTIIGNFFTLYFTNFWFSGEENVNDSSSSSNAYKDLLPELAAQSASPARELFITVASTIILTAIRFYFTFVIVSFTKSLLKQTSGQRLVADDEEDDMNKEGRIAAVKRWMCGLEIKSSEILTDYFR